MRLHDSGDIGNEVEQAQEAFVLVGAALLINVVIQAILVFDVNGVGPQFPDALGHHLMPVGVGWIEDRMDVGAARVGMGDDMDGPVGHVRADEFERLLGEGGDAAFARRITAEHDERGLCGPLGYCLRLWRQVPGGLTHRVVQCNSS
jgi:hypothetical protein